MSKGIIVAACVLAMSCSTEEDPCSTPGMACLWAGTGERGFNIEDPDAHRLRSKLYFPVDLTFSPDDRAYIVDWNNHRIRRVEKDDTLVAVMGTDYEGDGPPEMEDRLPLCSPVGAVATTVAMNHTTDVEFGSDGKMYVAAWHNHKIRSFDPATDMVIVIAGDTNYGFSGDGGPACRARFDQPKALAIAADGTIYTIDQRNVRIRAIGPEPSRTITTIAGTGTLGNTGDGALAIDAQFGFDTDVSPRPSGALVLSDRFLYVADSLNNRIRRIDFASGIIESVAGSGAAGYSGDGGPAIQATFSFPMDIELGPDGRIYVADRDNHAIRAIDLATGTIETVVGNGTSCDTSTESCLANGPAQEVQLNEPYGIAFDAVGNLYVADTHNHRILRVGR